MRNLLLATFLLAAGVCAALLVPRDGEPPPRVERVSAQTLLGGDSEELLREALIVVVDWEPGEKPALSLEDAVEELEDADAIPVRGALARIDDSPGPEAGTLVWAVQIDTSATNVPDLFDPEAAYTIAFVDATGGGLRGVLKR